MVELICKIAGSLFVLTAAAAFGEAKAVSYTHLDVYKRQGISRGSDRP